MYLLFKIGEELFVNEKNVYVFVSITALWNFVAHIFGYVYFEGLMLVGIALVILCITKGIKNKWKLKECIGLGIGNGIILISYLDGASYCIVSVIAFVGTFVVCVKEEKKFLEMIKKGSLILIESFIISGWCYIRNIFLYGTVMGTNVTQATGKKYGAYHLRADVRAQKAKETMFQFRGFIE